MASTQPLLEAGGGVGMSRPASPQPTSSADVAAVEMAALPSSSPRSSSLQLDSRSSSAEISHEAGEEEQKALLPYPAILQRRALAQELYHTLRECTNAFEQLPRPVHNILLLHRRGGNRRYHK